MLDLDGVVYIGGDAVPGAPEHLARGRGSGLRLAFVTNNASRPPATVAEHLTALGVPADARATSSPRPRPRPGCCSTGWARARGWSLLGARGLGRRCAERRPGAGRRSTTRRAGPGHRLRARRARGAT